MNQRWTDNTMGNRQRTDNTMDRQYKGQTMQWPKDTKVVIRIRKSKKNRQHDGQKKKDKSINNDLQTKDNTGIYINTSFVPLFSSCH